MIQERRELLLDSLQLNKETKVKKLKVSWDWIIRQRAWELSKLLNFLIEFPYYNRSNNSTAQRSFSRQRAWFTFVSKHWKRLTMRLFCKLARCLRIVSSTLTWHGIKTSPMRRREWVQPMIWCLTTHRWWRLLRISTLYSWNVSIANFVKLKLKETTRAGKLDCEKMF